MRVCGCGGGGRGEVMFLFIISQEKKKKFLCVYRKKKREKMGWNFKPPSIDRIGENEANLLVGTVATGTIW